MQRFTSARVPGTPDEIWLVEHPPVFTLGRKAAVRHLHDAGAIPVVRTERGGQVTYHGPGQVVAYLLVDLRRRGLSVRSFVDRIEGATIATLALWRIAATRRTGAPGVYVTVGGRADGIPGAKIASLGIRVSNGCSYHGVALNVAMDLDPFSRIDPCGYPGQAVTDMRSCIDDVERGADPTLAVADLEPASVATRFGSMLAVAIHEDAPSKHSVLEPDHR